MSAAVGMAAAGKFDNKDYRVYTLTGDGEIQEGQIWEAAMWAGHRKLDNLVVIVDNNNLQIDGEIDKVCSPYPIDKKFEAFNFHTIVIDGNNFDEIRAAFKEARETKGQLQTMRNTRSLWTNLRKQVKHYVRSKEDCNA